MQTEFRLVGVLRVFVAGILVPMAASAQSDTVSGNDVHHACLDKNSEALQSFCAGYVIGVLEGIRYGVSAVFYSVKNEGDGATEVNIVTEDFLGICHPNGVEYEQYKDVFVKYLSENPSVRHESARSLMHQAWSNAFPCN